MKHKYSEKKALKKLGIKDFGYITENNIEKFAKMLPRMEPEVAKKALSQLPEFKELASEIVVLHKEIITKILEENSKSEEAFYTACSSIIQSLQEELKRDDIDSQERARIEDKMLTVAIMIGEKDSESKNFKSAMAIIGLLGLGLLFGGAVAIGAKNADKDDEDDLDCDTDDIDADIDAFDFIDVDDFDIE